MTQVSKVRAIDWQGDGLAHPGLILRRARSARLRKAWAATMRPAWVELVAAQRSLTMTETDRAIAAHAYRSPALAA